MNTMTINSGIAPIPSQPMAHYNPEVEQRVQQWFASGQLLAWIPILSQENFPGVPLLVAVRKLSGIGRDVKRQYLEI